MSKWHKLEKGNITIDNGELVLLCSADDRWIELGTVSGGYCFNTDLDEIRGVTHWMEIPKLPETDNE